MLEQIGVREELFDDAEGERPGEGLGIGERIALDAFTAPARTGIGVAHL